MVCKMGTQVCSFFFDASPLEARNADHIKSFLVKLKRETKVGNWQVDQASDALRILYKNYFNMIWAQDWRKVACIRRYPVKGTSIFQR